MPASRLALVVLALALAATGAQGAAEKKKGGGDTYLQFPALTASLNMAGGRRGVLTVETGLDVPDGALRARAAGLEPRLRDAYNRYLMTYAATIPPSTAPNPDAISLALQRATDEVLGKPGAKLLLGTILEN